MNVNGSIRDVFEAGATSYVGIDLTAGPGVDRVMSSHEIERAWPAETFNTVLCCEMLEHDSRPWITVAQMHRVLRPEGR